MFNNLILKQKQDKERLLSFSYVERTNAGKASKWLASDLIKVVLGPRRSGKSVFSLMTLKNLPFAYFNFDDESIPEKFDYDDFFLELRAVYGETRHILFDEIQNLPRWELFASRLHREGYNLVLTGSNARLLSRELSTALTGRHVPIEILPFDFKEYLKARQFNVPPENSLLPGEKLQLLNLLGQYLAAGGYPEVAVKNLDSTEYLKVLFDSLLFKDVVKRHKVRFSEKIDNLASYLINNAANQYSIRKLVKILGFNSGVTMEKYVRYLTEAYLMYTLNRYSPKAAERIKSPKKIYIVDNGFISSRAVQHSPDNGKLLENLVFIDLVKRGFEPNRNLFYYKTRNNREIDFVIKEGIAVAGLIQVSYELNNLDIETREVRALLEAGSELGVGNFLIITWNERKEIKKNGSLIKVVPVWEWLLSRESFLV